MGEEEEPSTKEAVEPQQKTPENEKEKNTPEIEKPKELHEPAAHSPSPSPVKKPEEPEIIATKAQESDDDTLEVNLHPEKSRWELSDDEDEVPEPKPTPKAPIAEAKP